MNNLETELKALVKQERELLHEILLRIRLVDEQELYLKRGYGSLFEYLTIEIEYSAGAAQRRIDAVRLSKEIPEVIESVKEGKLSLAQIVEAQKGFRRTEVGTEEKRELLTKLSEAPSGEAQRIVAEELSLPIITKNQARPQSDGSVRLSFTLSKEAAENLEQVKAQLSHSIPNGDTGEIFEKLLSLYLEKKKSTATVAVNPDQKTIPAQTRREVFQRDQCCQYKSSTGKICGSRYQLQTDHRQMRFFGGNHAPENLRLLCARHNRYVAKQIMKGEPAEQ